MTTELKSGTVFGAIQVTYEDGLIGLTQPNYTEDDAAEGNTMGDLATVLIRGKELPALLAALREINAEITRPLLRDVPTAGEA